VKKIKIQWILINTFEKYQEGFFFFGEDGELKKEDNLWMNAHGLLLPLA